jgi:hypothetical protein
MELYHTKKFGELLGYGKCALLYNENKLENITIHFNLYNIVDKRITEQGLLFNLTCNIKSVDTKYYFDLFVKINAILKGSKYYIGLQYMNHSVIGLSQL